MTYGHELHLTIFSLDGNGDCCFHLPRSDINTCTYAAAYRRTTASIAAMIRAWMSKNIIWRTVVGRFQGIPIPEWPFLMREASCLALFVVL